MATYRDDFFGPIRVPVLKGIDRRDVRDFLERYRKYVLWVTERARLEGAEPQIMQIKMCINNKLLKTLARFELKTSVEEISDEQLEDYLTGILAPSRYHVPDLDSLFGRLRLRSDGDGRDRVTALFADIEELVHDHGLGYLPDKDLVKYMYKALPKHVEKTIKDKMKIEGDDSAGKTLDGIYQTLVNHLDGMRFFAGASGQKLGTGRRGTVERPDIKCYKCAGPHLQRHCPRGKPDKAPVRLGDHTRPKESEWKGRSLAKSEQRVRANVGRTEGERQPTKSREEVRPGLRPRPQPSWKAKAAAKSAKDIGAAPAGSSGWAMIEKVEHVPYLLDTGATNNIMPERIFSELQGVVEMEPTELDHPIQIVQADGSTVLVRRTVTLEVALETSAGPYDLGRVTFRIIPGEASEILIGKAEMTRIGIISPEAALVGLVRATAASYDTRATTDGKPSAEGVALATEQPADRGQVEETTAATVQEGLAAVQPAETMQVEEATAATVQEGLAAVQPAETIQVEAATVAPPWEELAVVPPAEPQERMPAVPTQVERALVGKEEKSDPVRRRNTIVGDGVSVLSYMDDVAVLGRRGPGPRNTRGVWDVRPPRPGRARPINRGRGERGIRGNDRPPQHAAEELLRSVMTSCRETGMLAHLDLSEQFNHIPLVIGTASALRAWDSYGAATTQRTRPPERRDGRLRRARRRRMTCYNCGGPHHIRRCQTASAAMKTRLMALHRAGGIRRGHRENPSTAAAAAMEACPFGDMSMTGSSDGERHSGDGDYSDVTDPEMPPLVEDHIPPEGRNPRKAATGSTSAAVASPRMNGRRYLGWTRDGGHQYDGPGPPEAAGGGDTGTPREQRTAAPGQAGHGGDTLPALSLEEINKNRRLIGLGPLWGYRPRTEATNREGTTQAQRKLDAAATPWQPPLPPTSLRQRMLEASGGLRGCTSDNDVRRALGYPVYTRRRPPAPRTANTSEDTISVETPLPPDPRAGKSSGKAERPDFGLRLPPLECSLCKGNHFASACPARESGRIQEAKSVCYTCNGNHLVKNCPARKGNATEGAAGQ